MKLSLLIFWSLSISLIAGCSSLREKEIPKDRYSISIYGFQQPSELVIEINGEHLLNGRYDYHAGSGLSGSVVYYHKKGDGFTITAYGEVGTYSNGELTSWDKLKEFKVERNILPENGHYIEIGCHGNESRVAIEQDREYPGYL